MEKCFILSSFYYYYVCVNKKWAKIAKFSLSICTATAARSGPGLGTAKPRMEGTVERISSPPSACDLVVTHFGPLRYIAG